LSVAAAFSGEASVAQEPGKGRTLPSVAAKYLDPATEFIVVRLTDPQHSCVLPAAGNHVLTSRSMLYASNQTGRWEAFQMDLKNYQSRQLTEAGALDISSLAYLPTQKSAHSDKTFCHFDGTQMLETDTGRLRTREVYRVPEGFEKTPGASYSSDGQYAAFVEKGNGKFRLRVLQIQRGSASTVLETAEEIRDVRIRPKHPAVFYRLGTTANSIQFDGKQAKSLRLPKEGTGQAEWSADGNALLYLTEPAETHKIVSLRTFQPDTGEDALIANTTQFLNFSSNTDASVFAGASGSKASPYVLLLTRTGKRELTLAEHRANDSSLVAPLFSPNSQFVVFGSDRHGNPAIYWIGVDRFVSDTEDS